MDTRGEFTPLVIAIVALISGIVLFMILRTVMCATHTWPFGC